MRIMARTVYRAFPELDEFDDASCMRFVQAANAAYWRVAVRVLAILLVFVIGAIAAVVGGIITASAVASAFGWGEDRAFLLSAVPITVFLSVAGVAALLTRDVLLRLGVRRVLRQCGQCWKCHYNLLGMTVGEDLLVICPECGSVTKADPALGELVREGAAQVYRPAMARENEVARAARVQRRRVLVRRAFRASLAAAVVIALTVGSVWGLLAWQTKAASKDMQTAAAVRAQLDRLRAPGVSVEEASRQWARVAEITKRCRELTGEGTLVRSPSGAEAMFAPETLAPGADAAEYDLNARRWRSTDKSPFELDRAWTRQALDAARADGTLDRLARLSGLVDAQREVPVDGDQGVDVYAVAMQLRSAGLLAQAELFDAIATGDLERFRSIARVLGACRRILRRNGVDEAWITRGHYASIAERAASFPTPEWHDALLSLWLERPEPVHAEVVVELGRIACRAAVAKVFSNPLVPLKHAVGLRDEAYDGNFYWAGNRAQPRWPGLYSSNLNAIERIHDRELADVRTPIERRRATQPQTGLPLVDSMTAMMPMMHSMRIQHAAESRRAILTLCVERYRLVHGRLPATLEDAIAHLDPTPDASLLIDPLTVQSLRLVVATDSATGEQTYTLDSTAPAPAPTPPGDPAAVPVEPTLDP